ncbi:MAG: ROK family protein [Lentisphaeria bacterium]|jgi:glucokinase
MGKEVFPVLGVDVGGTKIAVCLADSTGRILAKERIDGGGKQPYATVVPRIAEIGQRLVKQAGLAMTDLRACGISAPGPIDLDKGVVVESPNMPWRNATIRDDLAAALGVAAYFDNDANAGMLAEWFFGAAQGVRNALYLTMSTGIGGGVITEGKLLHGANGNAGEVGHIVLDITGPVCNCGLRGCLEAYCGGLGVAQRAQELLRGRPTHAVLALPEVQGDLAKVRIETIRIAAQQGIPMAVELWDELCLRLAQGIGVLQMAYNPEVIVLGTLAIYSGEFLLEPVRRHLPRFAWRDVRTPCKIVTTALGTHIGELAGPATALYSLYQEGAWQPPWKKG